MYRYLALILALLMIISLFSCGEATGDPSDTDTGDSTALPIESETEIQDNVPEGLDYDGETITFLSLGVQGTTIGQITVPELTGDAISDAVFERNTYVENRLNVRIENIDIPYTSNPDNNYVVVEKIARAVHSNLDDYDACTAGCYTIMQYSLSGIFTDLATMEYPELDQPWWYDKLNDAISYKNHQYTAAGSLLLSTYRYAFATVFNKDMFTDAKQPYLYDYVENGTWTLDKQISLLPIFHVDNGNGVQDTQGDVYGLITGLPLHADAYLSSCEIDILTKDEHGDYQYAVDGDRLHSVVEKVLQLYFGSAGATHNRAGKEPALEMFSQGYGAMITIRLAELENAHIRNMEQTYGIVPMPRFSEDQDGYYTMLHDAFTSLAVPTTVEGEQLDMVGAVLESMASSGLRMIKPVYYDTVLRTRLAKDPESARMLDIIMNGIRVDAGILHLGSLNFFNLEYRSLVDSNNGNVISWVKKRQKSDERAIDLLNKKLTKMMEEGQ